MWPSKFDPIVKNIQAVVRAENAYLLPVRIFIGIGWIRAGLEKLIEPGWLEGTSLKNFLSGQLHDGLVVFPFYQTWIENTFLPGALAMSWVILAGQLLVGLAVLSGTLTNFALLWGLFMNLNFILAGQVTPSAFYVVIQIVLLLGNAGAIVGLDQLLGRRIPLRILVARTEASSQRNMIERRLLLTLALLTLGAGILAIPFIRDYSPHSVDDPAMILLVLGIFTSLSLLIAGMRLPGSLKAQGADSREATRPRPRHQFIK